MSWWHGGKGGSKGSRDPWQAGWGAVPPPPPAAPNAAHDPSTEALPRHLNRVDADSIMVYDTRDRRMVSPFQGWTAQEIVDNAAASINVMTERELVATPASGYFIMMNATVTLQNTKLQVNVSVDCPQGVPCGGWDTKTAMVFAEATRFQPFEWPLMYDSSPTFIDLKVKNNDQLIGHITFRGYRSVSDMSVEKFFWDEFLIGKLSGAESRPSITVVCFMGWRISAVSYELGGQLYAVSENGLVAALDFARSRIEFRRTKRNSTETMGNDADRIEFRYRDSNNQMDCRAMRVMVPSTWLVVSHISGPALIETIKKARDQGCRIEGPEQIAQFSQLAAIHSNWFEGSETDAIDDPERVAVKDITMEDPANLHRVFTAKLFQKDPVWVDRGSFGLGAHDRGREVVVRVLPPQHRGQLADAVTEALDTGVRQLEISSGGSALAVEPARRMPHQQHRAIHGGERAEEGDAQGSAAAVRPFVPTIDFAQRSSAQPPKLSTMVPLDVLRDGLSSGKPQLVINRGPGPVVEEIPMAATSGSSPSRPFDPSAPIITEVDDDQSCTASFTKIDGAESSA